MGGKTRQKSRVQVPEGVQEIYDAQSQLVQAGMPIATQQLMGAMQGGGSPEFLEFLDRLYAPYEREAGRARDELMRQTPRGGAQDYAIAEIARDMALQRSTDETDLLLNFLNIYYGLMAGYNPQQAIGRDQVSSEPFMLGIQAGPLSANVPIGGG